jgi:hypothetical protein
VLPVPRRAARLGGFKRAGDTGWGDRIDTIYVTANLLTTWLANRPLQAIATNAILSGNWRSTFTLKPYLLQG